MQLYNVTQSCQQLDMHYFPGCRFRNQYIHRILHKQFFWGGGGLEMNIFASMSTSLTKTPPMMK